MKKIIISLTIYIVTMLFMYGLFAFVSMDPNVFAWPETMRGAYAGFGSLIGFALVAGYLLDDEVNKRRT